MRIDKLAMTSREALQNAIGIAADAQAAAVEPIHLLAALLTSGERNISVIIERIGADPAQLANATQQAISRAPKVEGAQQQLGRHHRRHGTPRGYRRRDRRRTDVHSQR